MTDKEINEALALAIGWVEGDFWPVPATLLKLDPNALWICPDGARWKAFDYRDPAVIWPIAVEMNMFPYKTIVPRGWSATWAEGPCSFMERADTAEKAVALAVIASQK